MDIGRGLVHMNFHTADLPQQHVCMEDEVYQQLWNQETNCSLDQEDLEPPQIKEEQEDPEPPQIKEEQDEPDLPQIKEEQEDPEMDISRKLTVKLPRTETPGEKKPLQRPASASPTTDEKTLLAAISALSCQLTQFSTEVRQQFAEMSDKMACISERLVALESNTDLSRSEGLKRKRRQNNPKIAEAIRRLHNSVSNESRYAPLQGLCSPHNAGVTSVLVETLKASPDFHSVDSDVIVSACKTYYETVRRNFRYSQPGLADKATAVKSSARCRSRRKRLLEGRQSVLVGEEMAFWKGVTIDLMSDEEDGIFEGVSGWIVRPPNFRSQELSDLCSTLQKRLEANPKYITTHRKRLYVGPCSERMPPPHGSEVDKHFMS